jgi:inorganic pyrophosphatase
MLDNNNLNKIDKKQPKIIKHFKSKYKKKKKNKIVKIGSKI